MENGSNVDIQNKDGQNDLMLACSNGNTEVVKPLLESGANIINKNEEGYDALMFAIIRKWDIKIRVE